MLYRKTNCVFFDFLQCSAIAIIVTQRYFVEQRNFFRLGLRSARQY